MKKIKNKNESNTLILHFIWMTFVVAIIYIWSQTAVFIFPIWILIFPILIFVLIIQSNTHVQENKNEEKLKDL